jgi:molecular chaperone Hsp33
MGANVTTPTDDFVQTFQIEGMNVRGRIVRLGAVADRVLQAHSYPDGVSALTGEALAIAAMLGASLKFDGVLTLQTRGGGPLRMLVADFSSPGVVRACASFNKDAVLPAAFAELHGEGSFALTIDQGAEMERYQGIVPLAAEGLVASALEYFRQSEQIPTAMRVAAAPLVLREADGKLRRHWRAGGIMIQNMAALGGNPVSTSDDPDEDFRRAEILMNTTEDHELLDPQLDPARLLFRLFHEDGVRVFPPVPLSFGCRCSRERVGSVLAQYPAEDLHDLLIDGQIVATCEFCSTEYRFSPDEAGGVTDVNS